ncbi:hypothetical protein ACRALDRAFT_213114 [Sodiomyces alcalophilus JCM 7366]|uniref:uncharacterized protein n=1 Tax=Sodiomyces alcalophilus JCM 7366 TaxID=591952 RepID=UPI0039B53C52
MGVALREQSQSMHDHTHKPTTWMTTRECTHGRNRLVRCSKLHASYAPITNLPQLPGRCGYQGLIQEKAQTPSIVHEVQPGVARFSDKCSMTRGNQSRVSNFCLTHPAILIDMTMTDPGQPTTAGPLNHPAVCWLDKIIALIGAVDEKHYLANHQPLILQREKAAPDILQPVGFSSCIPPAYQ